MMEAESRGSRTPTPPEVDQGNEIEYRYQCCEEHEKEVRLDEQEQLRRITTDLYDAGFKSPILIVEAAIAYRRDPTVPGHPEKQKFSASGRYKKGVFG